MMIRKNQIVLLLLCYLVAGCEPIYYLSISTPPTTTESYSPPEIGIRTISGIGDVIVQEGTTNFTPAIRAIQKINYEEFVGTTFVPVNTTAKASDVVMFNKNSKSNGVEAICFDLKLVNTEVGDWGTGKVCKNQQGEFKWLHQYVYGEPKKPGVLYLTYHPFSKWPDISPIEEYKVPDPSAPSMVQEFIYNGKTGSIIKFIYREYSSDLSKPAFTQRVQYDLNESDIVRFKSLTLRISSAENNEIIYVIESGFK